MKTLAVIIAFTLVTPSVFAAPGQSLMSHEGPGARGMTRSDRGVERNGGPQAKEFATRAPATAPTVTPSAAERAAAQMAAAERAAADRAKATREAERKARREAALQEELRNDRENQAALERAARAGDIIRNKPTPAQVQEALRLRGQAVPLPESETGKPIRNEPFGHNNVFMRKPVRIFD